MHCRHSVFWTHFPRKTCSAHQNDCLSSGPHTTVESFRRIHVEILLRSDLTRVPLGVWLPQMIYAHGSFNFVLHSKCSYPEGARLHWLFVCVQLMFVCLSGNSLGHLHFSCNVLVYPQKAFCWGTLTQVQFSALLSQLWSRAGLPNAIGRKGLWSAPWLVVRSGYFDSAGCDEVCMRVFECESMRKN